MKVAYITMVFPMASETFACVDISALVDAGDDVRVFALRSAQPYGVEGPGHLFRARARIARAREMLAERGLAELRVDHGEPMASLRGLRLAALHPEQTLDLVRWASLQNRRNPGHVLRSLLLVPRSMDVFHQLSADPPEVVHLFWGHYPSLVGHMVERWMPEAVLSMFLGAYDLRMRYAASAGLAARADVLLTHVERNKVLLRELGVDTERVSVVYRGIDTGRFSPVDSARVPHRVVTAGRLVDFKRVDLVLKVFAQVRAKWTDATLVVLGDGPLLEAHKALAVELGIDGQVDFTGHSSHEVVRKHMTAADVFLLMSDLDHLPNVVKEAMASGCACVVSRTHGIDELIPSRNEGWVVDCGDVAGAAGAIDAIFSDRTAADAMREAGRAHVIRTFDSKTSMGRVRGLWRAAGSRAIGRGR